MCSGEQGKENWFVYSSVVNPFIHRVVEKECKNRGGCFSESEAEMEKKIEILLSAPIWHAGDILKYLVGSVIVVALFWKLGKIII